MENKRLVGLLILLLLVGVGCSPQIKNITSLNQKNTVPDLIKVEIFFTDDKTLIGYVKELGIEQQKGKVYVGGSSLNYLYNKEGEIIGSYNYQRVLYIKLLSEEEQANK